MVLDVKPDYRATPTYFQGISFLQYQLQMRSNKDSVVFGNVFKKEPIKLLYYEMSCPRYSTYNLKIVVFGSLVS